MPYKDKDKANENARLNYHKHKATKKAYYNENKEKIQSYKKDYSQRPYVIQKDKDRNKTSERIAYKKQYIKDYSRERCHTDIAFKIERNLRTRVYQVMKGISKSAHTMKLLDCSIPELRLYIESKFQKGMTWDNYGEWHLDHVIPCDTFDLTDSEQQKICFHYTNLQPLWAVDNLKKHNKLNWKN